MKNRTLLVLMPVLLAALSPEVKSQNRGISPVTGNLPERSATSPRLPQAGAATESNAGAANQAVPEEGGLNVPAGAVPGSFVPPASGALQAGIFEEESNLNLQAAMTAYRGVITQFDRQRENAANAIFRLGECYRKLGNLEEAKVQYARILREFTDQRELVQLAQKQLFAESSVAASRNTQPTFQRRLAVVVDRKGELYQYTGASQYFPEYSGN